MNKIQFSHGGGVGDGLMFSPLIKEYSKTYEVGVTIPSSLCNSLFPILYKDYPNVKWQQVITPRSRELTFAETIEHSGWRTLEWERDFEKEEEVYNIVTKNTGREYVLVHERKSENCGRNMQTLNRDCIINKDLPVISLHHITNINILHYATLLNRAAELHFYEGSFSNLADCVLESNIPKFVHLYCKPHLFDKNMVPHNQVVPYIEEGKWHKQKWGYIYKNGDYKDVRYYKL